MDNDYREQIISHWSLSDRDKVEIIIDSEKSKAKSKSIEKWVPQQIEEALHAISLATIKWGMLNHDSAKEIVFNLDKWAAKSGNTGPYLLYAYARTCSLGREVVADPKAKVDYHRLSHNSERRTLTMLHNYWTVIQNALNNNDPKEICDYLFSLAKSYNIWWEQVPVKSAEDIHVQATRLAFVRAFALVLKQGLALLGIATIDRM